MAKGREVTKPLPLLEDDVDKATLAIRNFIKFDAEHLESITEKLPEYVSQIKSHCKDYVTQNKKLVKMLTERGNTFKSIAYRKLRADIVEEVTEAIDCINCFLTSSKLDIMSNISYKTETPHGELDSAISNQIDNLFLDKGLANPLNNLPNQTAHSRVVQFLGDEHALPDNLTNSNPLLQNITPEIQENNTSDPSDYVDSDLHRPDSLHAQHTTGTHDTPSVRNVTISHNTPVVPHPTNSGGRPFVLNPNDTNNRHVTFQPGYCSSVLVRVSSRTNH